MADPQQDDPTAEPPPSEEELQRRLEEQLRQVRVQDLLLESVASILNLSARRIGKADERDLEQARIGIEAVRAVVDLLEPGPREQVREALAQVQMLFAREAQGAGEAGAGRRSAAGGRGPAPADARDAATRRRPRAAPAAVDAAWLVVIPTHSLKFPRLAAGHCPAVFADQPLRRTSLDRFPDRLRRLDRARLRGRRGALRRARHAGAAARSPGNERMQEISGAVQEGARRTSIAST